MKRNIFIVIFSLFILPFNSFAQADVFQGTWHMEYLPAPGKIPVIIDLQIGSPEKNLLYPAEIKLRCDSFSSTYHLLLAKRNLRQLAIGKNKIASSESGFSIGNWTIYLNGIFDLSRDIKGVPLLTAERMPARQYGVEMRDPSTFPASQKTAATLLRDFLKDAEIKLKKINNETWQSAYADSILNPGLSPDYYGIRDTITLDKRNGSISFTGNKKTDNGTVSLMLNGGTVVDQADLLEKKPAEDIKLDTGLNILIFFADSYGKSITTSGKVNVDFAERKFALDFADKKDIASTFIVAKLYYAPGKEKESTALENSITNELSEADLQRDIKTYHYPDPEGRNLFKTDSAKALVQKTLLRDARPVGNLKANTRKIILAIWDDAVEDGDSISLNINGNWIVQGFAVKKKPQFISVTLDPGPNKIIFIANNLGYIPPNTAVLEIIDGKQRKAFMIETDFTRNNLINILYDLKDPG